MSRSSRDKPAPPAVEVLDASRHRAGAGSLRSEIVEGRIKQGDQLREIRLAQLLGTGRGTVREALRHSSRRNRRAPGEPGIFVRRFAPTTSPTYTGARGRRAGGRRDPARATVSPSWGSCGPASSTWPRRQPRAGRGATSPTWTSPSTRHSSSWPEPRLARCTRPRRERGCTSTLPLYSTVQSVADHEQIVDALETASLRTRAAARASRLPAALPADGAVTCVLAPPWCRRARGYSPSLALAPTGRRRRSRLATEPLRGKVRTDVCISAAGTPGSRQQSS